MEWKILTDNFGTQLGLWWSLGSSKIILDPTNSIAKCFDERHNRMTARFVEWRSPDVENMQRRGRSQ